MLLALLLPELDPNVLPLLLLVLGRSDFKDSVLSALILEPMVLEEDGKILVAAAEVVVEDEEVDKADVAAEVEVGLIDTVAAELEVEDDGTTLELGPRSDWFIEEGIYMEDEVGNVAAEVEGSSWLRIEAEICSSVDLKTGDEDLECTDLSPADREFLEVPVGIIVLEKIAGCGEDCWTTLPE